MIYNLLFQKEGEQSAAEIGNKYNIPKSTLHHKVDTFRKKIASDATDKDIEYLRNLFLNRSKRLNQTKHLKIQPRIQRNQIWSVKNDYDDFQGISQNTACPFLVLINNDPDDIEDENFTRVLIVSPFVEMAFANDEVSNDSSIIGFPFLIETWNDQPILTELLDEYIGYYEAKSISFSKFNSFELVNLHRSNSKATKSCSCS